MYDLSIYIYIYTYMSLFLIHSCTDFGYVLLTVIITEFTLLTTSLPFMDSD